VRACIRCIGIVVSLHCYNNVVVADVDVCVIVFVVFFFFVIADVVGCCCFFVVFVVVDRVVVDVVRVVMYDGVGVRLRVLVLMSAPCLCRCSY